MKGSTMATDTARVTELKTAWEGKRGELKSGLNAIKIDGANVEIKSEDFARMTEVKSDMDKIENLIALEVLPDDAKTYFQAGDLSEKGASAAMRAAAAQFGGIQNLSGAKTLGEMFTQSEDFQHFQKTGRLTMDQPWEMEAKDMVALGNGTGMEQKDVFTGLMQGGINPRGFGSIQFDPMLPRTQRQNRVRSLFPVVGTNANLIDYFRVLGFAEGANGRGNAKTVADRTRSDGTRIPEGEMFRAGANQPGDVFGLKPKSNLRFESAQAPVRTIAHWEAAHRNVLSDEPQLQGTINNELLYGLALAEDDQILNGDGEGDNLLGILNTEGVQQYSQETGDRKSDALRRAATLCVIANYAGTGFVMHPFDWEDIELQKASGDGQYMLVTNVAVGASTSVWRQPVVETPAMPEGTFLTGAFGIGAQLYDRQVASIRIAEQHADFFVRNAVAILAEERLALAVKRPESFVVGKFTATTQTTAPVGG